LSGFIILLCPRLSFGSERLDRAKSAKSIERQEDVTLPVPLFRVISIAVLAEALHLPAVFTFLEILRSSARIEK
jgi:hypothetical protein